MSVINAARDIRVEADGATRAMCNGVEVWPGGIFDGFSGTIGNPLNGRLTESGAKVWAVTDGGGFELNGAGEAFRSSGSGAVGAGAIAHLDAGFSDAHLSVDTAEMTINSTIMGVVFRYVNDLNFWTYFRFRAGDGTRYHFLRSFVGGVIDYDHGSTSGATTGDVHLEVICDGTSIECYWDGVLVESTTSTTHLTATGFGLNADIGSGYDNFSVVAA